MSLSLLVEPPLAPDYRVPWEELQVFPWVRALEACPQDPIHHAEGNVWIHTRMVLETLAALPEEPSVDFAFIDADKTGYDAYYEACLTLLRRGGLIVLDNMLQGGRVLDPADDRVRAIDALNQRIQKDERVENVFLPIRDGIMLAYKR